MQTITVEIKNDDALKVLQDLQEKQFISIITKADKESPALPGNPMTDEEFSQMIKEAENSGSMSLTDAKAKWAGSL